MTKTQLLKDAGGQLLVLVNRTLWVVVILGPLLFPATSSHSSMDIAVSNSAKVFFYGLILSMNINLARCRMSDSQEKGDEFCSTTFHCGPSRYCI